MEQDGIIDYTHFEILNFFFSTNLDTIKQERIEAEQKLNAAEQKLNAAKQELDTAQENYLMIKKNTNADPIELEFAWGRVENAQKGVENAQKEVENAQKLVTALTNYYNKLLNEKDIYS